MTNDEIKGFICDIEEGAVHMREAIAAGDMRRLLEHALEIRGWADSILEAAADSLKSTETTDR